MRGFATIYQMTLHEALRRRILLATLVCGLGFLVLFGCGFYFVHREVGRHGNGVALEQRMILTFFMQAGMYAANFLTIMTAIMMPVDSLAGEIASGVMQTLASKPVRRSTILLGKWLAHATVLAGYLALIGGGVLAVARVIGGITAPDIPQTLSLMLLEGLVLLTLSIAFGTRLSTITNGIVVLGMYGLAFVGGWTEQLGTLAHNETTRYLGTLASLIEPSESMWHLAAWHMQPSIMRDMPVTPFSPASVPSPAMVAWAAGYVVVLLLLAIRSFEKRGL